MNLMLFLLGSQYVFTKLMKPFTAILDEKELYIIVIYLYDMLIFAKSANECKRNISIIKTLLKNLGFILHLEKSNLIPAQRCTFLGFTLNCINMSLELPCEKRQKTLKFINYFMLRGKCKIKEFATLIGTLISICPAIEYVYLYIKIIDKLKTTALRKTNKNYNKLIKISTEVEK